jgi:large subunit ribosomal protein L25
VLTGRSQHHTFILKEIIIMSFVFQAEVRSDLGKGASRRLRHADLVPAIVYGAGKEAQSVTVDHKKLILAQEKPEFYSSD